MIPVLASAMSEKELSANVVDAALKLGWLCYHTYDSRKSAPGFPDLVLLRRDRLVFIELKTERARTSPAQEEWLRGLASLHGDGRPECYLWRPADWLNETIMGVLR